MTADEERAAIVAWLRADATKRSDHMNADAIERLAHHERNGHEQ